MHVNFLVSSAIYLRNHGLMRTRNFATNVKYRLFLLIIQMSAISGIKEREISVSLKNKECIIFINVKDDEIICLENLLMPILHLFLSK